MIYQDLKKNPNPRIEITNNLFYNFGDGAFVEITGVKQSNYTVKFINKDTQQVVYETVISTNMWTKTSVKYFVNWRIEVYEGDKLTFEHDYNAEGKGVYITFDSKSLGDTIAWMPYVLEFQKKHNCRVVVSTFRNDLFKDVYPELEFVEPGVIVDDLYAVYKLGWFYDSNKEPVLPNIIPLQQTATNILGLEYKEMRPRIKHVKKKKNIYNGKYVAIATNSTAGCKFWTREGWQEVINYLSDRGYKVVNVSQESNPFDNCHELVDKSMDNTMAVIKDSEFFIGLSSGLSWLAWALEVPVVMIANFSKKWHEFECIRIANTSVCHGCWNNRNFKFDRGDWNWCPINKNTPDEFECQRSISSRDVLEALSHYFRI